jgi:hypothetical protein
VLLLQGKTVPLIVKRQSRSTLLLLLGISILTGCTASQTSYLRERGELAHYVGSELEIEYPDLAHQPITEVAQTRAPITLSKPDFDKPWELSLQEVVQTALKNSKVIRNLGSVTPFGFADGLSGRTAGAATVYDQRFLRRIRKAAYKRLFPHLTLNSQRACFGRRRTDLRM